MRQGKKEEFIKDTLRSNGPAAAPPGFRQNMCVLELVLLSVPLAAQCAVMRVMRQSPAVFPPKGSSCSHWQEVLLTKVVSTWQSEHIQV